MIELLVVIAIIAILASLLLPVLSIAKAKAHRATCQSNLKQLQFGWHLYLNDNEDKLVPNKDGDDGAENWISYPGSWVVGNAQLDLTTTNIELGVQYKYHPNVTLYRCPSDRTEVDGAPDNLITRTYMLNGWLNGPDWLIDQAPYVRTKYVSLKSPARTFAFTESKNSDSGSFYIYPFGYPHDWVKDEWINVPGDWHDRGCNLSFADGHVEYHRWRAPKQLPPGQPYSPEDEADLRWLQDLIPKE